MLSPRYTIEKTEFYEPNDGCTEKTHNCKMTFELDVPNQQLVWLPGTPNEERHGVDCDLGWSSITSGGERIIYYLVLHDSHGATIERRKITKKSESLLIAREYYIVVN